MSPHPPRKFRRIALKSPAELSHYKRLSRSPRKLAAEKCDNCRKGKSKCVPQGRGCQRCLHKGLHCPGLTKPKRTKSGPSVLAEPSPSSTITTPLIIKRSSEAPVSPPSELSAEDVAFDSQSAEDDESTFSTLLTDSPGVEESNPLDELQGLGIALDLLDELGEDCRIIEILGKQLSDIKAKFQQLRIVEQGRLTIVERVIFTGEWIRLTAEWIRLLAAAQVQLPSATVFLTQLRAFCDGRLTCIGPKCQGVQFFDASWDGLVSHYKDYHAYHLLQGQGVTHWAALKHLFSLKRDMKRLFDKARVHRAEWEFMDSHSRVMEELRCSYRLKCEFSAYGRLQRSPQFDVLKDLNNVFSSRYQRFYRFAADSPSGDLSSFLGEIREKCPTPKDLRRLGTRIFKQVVRGTPPNALLEIFAFISLSQAMAAVMQSRHIQIDADPGTIDYLAWRTCIEDEPSRRLYDEILIAWFHPRWREELQSGGRHQTPLSVQETMKRLVIQLMKAKETNAAFNFSAFLRLEPFPRKQANQGWTRTWWDENCESAPPPVETLPNEEENDDPGGTGTRTLTNTVIFIRASLFMIFIAALGVALLYLSNPEQRCYILSATREEHVASVYHVVLVTEMLKDRIFNRLGQDSRLPALEDIVASTEEALDGGYVWSVSDLHVQLEQAVQNHVEEPSLRLLLYTEIRRLCKEALNWVEPICERHRGGCMFVPVAV